MSMYIENAELERELAAWRRSSDDPAQRIPSERLGQLLIDLHDNVLRHSNFCRYRQDLKDEMKSYSLFRILKCGLKSFDPEKAKAFSYFTRAVFVNYITVIRRYYKKLNQHEQYVRGELAKIDTHGDPLLERLVSDFGIRED